jgi:hypothetical protein
VFQLVQDNLQQGSIMNWEKQAELLQTLLSSNLPSFASQLKVSSANATTAVPTSTTSIAVSGTQAGRDFWPFRAL